MDTQLPPLSDAAEVAAHLGVDRSAVNRWARDGALPEEAVYEWGVGRRRVRRFRLDLILEAGRVDRPTVPDVQVRPEQPIRSSSRRGETVEDVLADLDQLAGVG